MRCCSVAGATSAFSDSENWRSSASTREFGSDSGAAAGGGAAAVESSPPSEFSAERQAAGNLGPLSSGKRELPRAVVGSATPGRASATSNMVESLGGVDDPPASVAAL